MYKTFITSVIRTVAHAATALWQYVIDQAIKQIKYQNKPITSLYSFVESGVHFATLHVASSFFHRNATFLSFAFNRRIAFVLDSSRTRTSKVKIYNDI